MGLLSGLEKFGLKASDSMDLFEEEQKDSGKKDGNSASKIPTEDEFLLEKTVKCRVCDHVFKTKVIKSGRLKSLEPDKDMRPRFQYVDTLKYDVTSCPACGYTATNSFFERISSAQEKLIREQISSQFQPGSIEEADIYTYDMAADRYILALANAKAKKARAGEKAYICLKLSWLLRGKIETMPENTPEEKAAKEECKKEEEIFYQQAYDGFLKAISQETFPICGMDESRMDYLLAYMSFHFKKFDLAARFVTSVITSATASRRLKDMAQDLRQEIKLEIRKANTP